MLTRQQRLFVLSKLFDAEAHRVVSHRTGLSDDERVEYALSLDIFSDEERAWLAEAPKVVNIREAIYNGGEQLPRVRKRLALVSIASGSHVATLDQTRPSREAYARRVGADLIELTDDRYPAYPMVNKWRLYTIARVYERTLYLDSDVWVANAAPNIFDVVPEDKIGIVDELPVVLGNGRTSDYYWSALSRTAAAYGIQPPDWCPNGGVMVIPRRLAGLYRAPTRQVENDWCLDQYELAIQCEKAGRPVHFLDERFNWMWIDRRFWGGLKDAWFLHANATGDGKYREMVIDQMRLKGTRVFPPAQVWQPDWDDDRLFRPEVPRVTYLSPAMERIGGTETWHETFVPEIAKDTLSEGIAFVRHHIWGGERCKTRVYRAHRDAARLAKKSDVIITWGCEELRKIVPAKGERGHVIHVHHGDEQSVWSHGIVDENIDSIDCLVAVSPSIANALKLKFGHRCRVEYIPNAVDPRRLKTTEIPATVGQPVVLWAARLSAEKRPQLFVEAARRLIRYQCVVVGARAEGHGVDLVDPPSNLKWVGALPTIANWLSVANVFVSTASEEGFGLSMGEAMLAGVPVVATPYGLGLVEDLVWQVSANPTPDELADAIESAVEGNMRKQALAKKFIEDHHSVPLVTQKWIDLIRELTVESRNGRTDRARAVGVELQTV